jgi:hypothetical protein
MAGLHYSHCLVNRAPDMPSALAPSVGSRAAVASKQAPREVTIYPTGIKQKVTPDTSGCVPWPDHLPVPTMIGVFEMQPQPDGTFKPMLRLHTTWVRMKANITEELGLGITYASLRRLMLAGFVRSKQVTPGQYSFCLQSYNQHLARVKADPEFWSPRGPNLKRYMEAI